jgi:ribose transport system substrate-binding protein
MVTRSSRAAIGAVVLASALLLAACSSSSKGSSGGSSSSSAAASPTATSSASAPVVASSTPAATGPDVTAAKALVAPFTGHPSVFPIDTPLAKKPTGKRIAYIDCGTPICGLFSQLMAAPVAQLGMTLTSIKTGFDPEKIQTAFDTIVQAKYDGVIVPAIPPQLWQRGLASLTAAGIPVATTGVTGVDPTTVKVQQAGDKNATLAGKLMAAEVVVKNGESNIVFYDTPELPFVAVIQTAFLDELKTLCANCTVRTVKIAAATFDVTAANTIVSDLQAHPDTKVAVFGIGEQAHGLPAALKIAGIKVWTLANSPDPQNLQDIKTGSINEGLALDLPVISWTLADTMARQTTGAAPAPGAVADIAPQQLLSAADLQFDVSKGWTGYPDFATRFGTLWANAQ